MSIEAVAWALKVAQVMDPTAKLILIGLADHAHDDGSCSWPSQSTLARYAGCTTRTVYTKLRWLEDAGLIRLGDQGLVDQFPANRRPTVWNLRLESWAEGDSGQKEILGRSTIRSEIDAAQKPASDKPSLVPSDEGTTGTLSSQPKKARRSASNETPSTVVKALCDYLADKIEANGSKRPSPGVGWYRDCRLMIEQDGREPDKIRAAIDWSQADGFWRANIRSMRKLREHYDQMRLKAIEQSEKAKRSQASQPPERKYTEKPTPDRPPWEKKEAS